jgi:carboxypeptidase A2
LITGYGSDDVVTYLLDTYDWHFVIVVNPDGYAYTHTVSILSE